MNNLFLMPVIDKTVAGTSNVANVFPTVVGVATIVGAIASVLALFKKNPKIEEVNELKKKDWDKKEKSLEESYEGKYKEIKSKVSSPSEYTDAVEKLDEEKKNETERLKEQHEKRWKGIKLFGRIILTNKQLTYKMAEKDAGTLAKRILEDHYYPSIIVAIGRGGCIFGSMLSYKLFQVPIFCVDRTYSWQKVRIDGVLFDFEIPPRLLDKVLLVSGEVHSSNTMDFFSKYLYSIGAREIKTCTFYLQNIATAQIDYNITNGLDIPFMPWQPKDALRDSINPEWSNILKDKQNRLSSNLLKTVYIIRHGETGQNSEDVFIGSGTDNAVLTRNGRKQATSAGAIIKSDIGDNKVIINCSPQKRCVDTAGLLCKSLTADIKPSTDLKERNYGAWEGKERSILVSSDEYSQYVNNPLRSCPPGAESIQDNISRVLSFWDKEIVADDADCHVIVTHKTTGRLLLSYLMNKPYSGFRNVKFDNDSVVRVTVNGKNITYEYLR